ncbi:MAG TPA: hypothetical protein DCL42_04495 [Deltaproteobacteria bacterium]|nr:MAG: hypothetical protein A2067_09490 [Deltaproteobacteria bacterium GWB2_42_7]OGQ75928.1 MAG: hypothetical protein A2235_04535 [Deltaproteobacteria bacterium RIFOXYA2_FULL_42_10]HAG50577.1 hypothetical protein [Deltaproteobacteria bacterium]
MTYTLRFLAEVEDDAIGGYIWYDTKSHGLGEEFLRMFYAYAGDIPRNPLLYRKVYGEIRRCLLKRFPYAIYPKNAVAFFGKRNLWPNTASKLAVQILTYLKQYAPFCPAIFFLSLAQILRLSRKIKTKCIFRVYITIKANEIVVMGLFHCAREPHSIRMNLQDRKKSKSP